ncbi:MAG: hypothetical protein EBU46_17155, partial [Nitrosomonadaceae bacterium]|nr:hypothetical protein [Nitrosomonadaceae bacterium]
MHTVTMHTDTNAANKELETLDKTYTNAKAKARDRANEVYRVIIIPSKEVYNRHDTAFDALSNDAVNHARDTADIITINTQYNDIRQHKEELNKMLDSVTTVIKDAKTIKDNLDKDISAITEAYKKVIGMCNNDNTSITDIENSEKAVQTARNALLISESKARMDIPLLEQKTRIINTRWKLLKLRVDAINSVNTAIAARYLFDQLQAKYENIINITTKVSSIIHDINNDNNDNKYENTTNERTELFEFITNGTVQSIKIKAYTYIRECSQIYDLAQKVNAEVNTFYEEKISNVNFQNIDEIEQQHATIIDAISNLDIGTRPIQQIMSQINETVALIDIRLGVILVDVANIDVNNATEVHADLTKDIDTLLGNSATATITHDQIVKNATTFLNDVNSDVGINTGIIKTNITNNASELLTIITKTHNIENNESLYNLNNAIELAQNMAVTVRSAIRTASTPAPNAAHDAAVAKLTINNAELVEARIKLNKALSNATVTISDIIIKNIEITTKLEAFQNIVTAIDNATKAAI